MIRKRLALPLLAAVAMAAAGALAQSTGGHNSNAPIDWDANRIELQDQAHRAILSGNVHIKQQEMTLTADRVTANYTGSLAGGGSPQVHRLDASGNVVVTRPSETARGNYAIYDLDHRIITMIGNVSLDRNGSTVNGGRLVFDLATNHATMDGSAVGGAGETGKGGRVSGRFIVPQHNNSPNGGTTTPGKP
ncbi:MAG TPA: LptA/OstA family protein [Sphingomonas sp.]|nr:LptA/OstA family protein [Sphingomonas sp.]